MEGPVMDEQEKRMFSNTLNAMGLGRRKPVTKRDMDLAPYSDETRKVINIAISLDPALEEMILKVAEHAFADGEDSCE